ncbi:MAG TPA: quinone oxidoreductase [Rhodospirillaceae bacterium]|nr:quinone oxidoreductase [Rhodospirillaceae bacterium]
MTKAIRIHETGGPEVLKYEDIDVGDPGKGEIRIRQTACGLNFIDIYLRTGLYPLTDFPEIIGMEAAGVVEAVGEGVTDKKVGDRIAYPMLKGGYTQARNIPSWKAVHLPDAIDDQTAAAMMLKGMTAHYLLHRTYPVKPGDAVLVYAAAGGVGQILCQWGKALGATVIGCVGSAEKAEIAKAAGAAHTINYSTENIAEKAKEYTGGEGVAAAYDSIGKATFMASLDSLRPFGVLATYGNASGPVDPISPAILGPKGSLYLTRPTLATHTRNPEILAEGANALFEAVTSGKVKININQTYPLADVAQAHTDLEARKTTGSSILIP